MNKHERMFRNIYPLATIERQNTNGGERYYLVRKTRGSDMYSGSGSTKAAAWKAAALSLPIGSPTQFPNSLHQST